jgi:polyene glycosyltransferase
MGTTYHLDQYQALDKAVERIRPVLMVINNLCFHGFQVAMTRKIPFVLTSSLLPSDLYQHELPRDYPSPTSGLPRSMTSLQRIAHSIFRLRMKLLFFNPVILWRGIKYHDVLTRKGGVDRRALNERAKMETAELAISFSIFGLDYTFPAPPKLHMLGAAVPELPENPPNDELIDWLDNHSSVVYAAFGTITRLTRDEVNAMIDVAYRLGDTHCLLWKLPEEQQCLLPDVNELPSNVRIESWFRSQHEVLAHKNVRVFFNHGGSNSFHEGVFFGKPLLIRPLWLDCYDIAARTVDSGVGLVVDRPETIDSDDVHHKLTRLLNDKTFTERAQYFAERQRAAGGVAKAADLILGCAEKCARDVDMRRD